ncbi:MAG TPA: HTH domain-containing protein [Phycisphaerae bacterium]|nr:HTH domain-containing protein [Phycisphaerae bacterium]
MARTLLVDGEHLTRLMKLCRSIHQSGGASLQQLQGKLKTSRRTVFRDLSALQQFGIDVNSTSKGYQIKQNPAVCKKQIATRYERDLGELLRNSLK